MAERTEYKEPNYSAIDRVIGEWAEKHELRVDKDYKGDPVRSVWHANKVQIWFDPPDQEKYVKVWAAERREDLPSGWGKSLNWRRPISELADRAESIFSIVQSWL